MEIQQIDLFKPNCIPKLCFGTQTSKLNSTKTSTIKPKPQKKENMIIKIDNKYQIESDKYNWILKTKLKTPNINKKTGKIRECKDIGYFNSLESAVKYLADLKIRLIQGSDINKILKKIDKIRLELKKVLEPYEIKVS